MEKPIKHIVSLSGGKDSTAMLLRMLEEGMPVDIILFCDTGLEFEAMYRHIDKLEKYVKISITRLKAPQSFEYMFYEHMPKRKNPNLEGRKGFSWSGPRNRWCTSVLKTRVINRYLKDLSKEYTIYQYIGIAADEPKRVREFNYPLIDWGMTESDCLAYCKERGFDWDGLYDIFHRVSCWCCANKNLKELKNIYLYLPQYWQKLKFLQSKTDRPMKQSGSVFALEERFENETRA